MSTCDCDPDEIIAALRHSPGQVLFCRSCDRIVSSAAAGGNCPDCGYQLEPYQLPASPTVRP
jgi:rubrerythrin